MNVRAPQALVRVNVSNSTQNVLVEQQRLHPRAAPAQAPGECRL
jgi:hypothetical protein